MKTFKNIALLLTFSCATLSIVPVHANVTDLFKALMVDYKNNMTATAIEIEHWRQRLDPAAIELELATKIKALNDTTKETRNYIEKYERATRLKKQKNSLLPRSPKWADPKLSQLAMKHRKLAGSIKQMPKELELIKESFLPDAKRRYKKCEVALENFDIHWLKEMKQIQKLNIPELQLAGFNELYKKRLPDLKALRQGHLLNERTPDAQIELLETNRGIDPASRITIERDGTKHDMSVEFFEQNKLGAPLHVTQ